MSNINKAAVLNPFTGFAANIFDYVPRATTSEFGTVAIGSGINVDALGRIYLDTQEYSDRLTAIEAQAASNLATQHTEVAAAIAQVNLTQSQAITALSLEVSNLKTDLTNSITATQTDLINRADELAQDVTDITQQLTQDKATFTQEIQDALVYLQNEASVASALRTPRKINGTDFDGSSDITTDTWGATRSFKIGNKTNNINGASNVEYSLVDIGAFPDVGGTIQGNVEVTGNLSVSGTISATLEGTATSADKLHIARKIQGIDFDGTQDISLPIFSTQIDGLVPKRIGATTTNYLREDGTWVVPTDTTYALLTKASAEDGTATAANTISAQVLKEAIQYHAPTVTNIVGNAETATKLQTPRTINGVLFDGTQNILLPDAVAYSLPTASDSVLGGIKVGSGLAIANSVLSVDTLNQSTTGNAATSTKLQTARTISLTGSVTGSVSFNGSANASIATTITGLGAANGIATLDSKGKVPSAQLPSFGGVSSVAGKTGVVTLTKADVYLSSVDNTPDSTKNVASASKLTTACTIGGVLFDGTANINLPGVNIAGNQSTSGNAATATKLATGKTINNVVFDGTANITIPDATEATAGTAKIATTAIAQAGVNNTDFITPLKLRNALNASGNAPISACRAWVSLDGTTTPVVIQASINVSSVIINGSGDFTINFTNPMPTSFYAVFGSATNGIGGNAVVKILTGGSAAANPLLKTVNAIRVGYGADSSAFNVKELTIGVFC